MKKILKLILHAIALLPAAFQNRKQPANPKKIVLLMCNWLGDTFWAAQVINDLKINYPDAEVFVCIKPFAKPLLNWMITEENIIIINNVISDRTREKFSFRDYLTEVMKVRRLKADIIIDLTCNRYSAIFTWLSGARYTTGLDNAGEFSPLYSKQIPSLPLKGKHLSIRPKYIASSLNGQSGISDTVPLPPVPVFSKEQVREKLNIGANEKIIMLVPGAGWKAKEWQKEKYKTLAEYCEVKGFRIAVSGSEKERSLCEFIVSSLKNPVVLINDLELSVSLLPLCSCFVSADSGLAHISAAFGMKTITLFCYTNPEYCRPLGKNAEVIYSSCPMKPVGKTEYCTCAPAQECRRPENMNIPLESIISYIEEDKTV